MTNALAEVSHSFTRFASYRPPDPDEEGLTPRQAAERSASRRRAFLLYMEAQMTLELADIVVRSSYAELRRRLDITTEEAAIVHDLALRVRAAAKTWDGKK